MQIGHQTQLGSEAEIILMWLILFPRFPEKAILIHSNEKLKYFFKTVTTTMISNMSPNQVGKKDGWAE